jgi:hypothetical protein
MFYVKEEKQLLLGAADLLEDKIVRHGKGALNLNNG